MHEEESGEGRKEGKVERAEAEMRSQVRREGKRVRRVREGGREKDRGIKGRQKEEGVAQIMGGKESTDGGKD